MRSFRPTTWLLLGCLLALVSCAAFADTIPSTVDQNTKVEGQWTYSVGEGCGIPPETWTGTQASVCSQLDTRNSAFYACIGQPQNAGTYSSGPIYSGRCDHSGGSSVYLTLSSCPSGFTYSAGGCVGTTYSCPSGYAMSEDQQSCTKSDCQAGAKADSGMYTDTDGNGVTPRACVGGCWADFKGTGPYNHYSFNSQIYDSVYIGDYIADGQNCTQSSSVETPVTAPPEQTQPIDTPEYDCASQGMTSGTVNGVVLCMPPGTPDAPPVTDPDKIQQQNPDGSKTETENRDTVDGDSVTRETTTTQYDSSGNVVSQTTSSTTGSLGAFCEQNPDSAVCSESKVSGGGACDAPPVCSGDAASCAILRQQWEARCEIKRQNDFVAVPGDPGEFESKQTAISEKKQALADLIDTIRGEAAGLFTFSGAGAATLGCDAGVTTAQGFHVELCFSKYDDELQMIGAVLVFVSLVIAVFIMFS